MSKAPAEKRPRSPAEKRPRSLAIDGSHPSIDPYKKLLCRVAGNVVVGLLGSPSPALKSGDDYAAVALDLARDILRGAGVTDPDVAGSAEE